MKLSSAFVLLSVAASASAFAPPTQHAAAKLSPVALEMSESDGGEQKMSKRKRALKTAGKVAGAVGTVALATAGVPSAALAKAAKATVETVETVDNTKKLAAIGAGAFALGISAKSIFSGTDDTPMMKSIETSFPSAVKNNELVNMVQSALDKYDYGKDSLVATSLCADEVNRVLEKDFSKVYDYNFHMGGLAGFPFGGVTSFGAMASHIPDGGSCLVVFGPHVGVDSSGKVGTVERRGRANGGACCGSAVAASGYVAAVHNGAASKYGPPEEPTDAQQNFVGTMLLPYAAHLEGSNDKMTDLPFALYDAQKKMMDTIVQAGAGNVAGSGKVSVLGGIQINTPAGKSDYFLPLSFEVYDNKGAKIEDLSTDVNCGRSPSFAVSQ